MDRDNEMTNATSRTAEEMAAERTSLAIERTMMAARRTLMGWVRTALALITFGLTVYTFLEAALSTGDVGLLRARGPRRLGLFLIALGTLSAVMGTLEYLATLKRLGTLSGTRFRPLCFSVGASVTVALLGLFLFIAIAAYGKVF